MLNRIHHKIKEIIRILRPVKQIRHNQIHGNENSVEDLGNSYSVIYDIIGNHNKIFIDVDALITDLKFHIRGDNHCIYIGKKSKIKSGVFWMEDCNGELIIGNGTTIESAHLAVTEPNKKIVIGENCMLSTGINIRTGDSHSIIDQVTLKRINYAEDISIGNHVWIGANATILKGCNIGENSIIATGAIVTKDVGPNSIVGGIPAVVIKNGVSWKRERI